LRQIVYERSGGLSTAGQYRLGSSPMPMMLQADTARMPSAAALRSSSGLPAPGFSQTSPIPLRATSSITRSPTSGRT